MKKRLFPSIYPVTCHTKHVGHGSTFVAINGFKLNGPDFVLEAIERGATHVVFPKGVIPRYTAFGTTRDERFDCPDYQNIKISFADNTRIALAKLSSKILNHPASKLKIIGITGTAGKTSTAFLVEHILARTGHKTGLISSVKNKILDQEVESGLTTPSSDYLHMFFDAAVKKNVEYVVMEVSSHAIALHRTYGIEFDAIGFTNLSSEHMDFHKTMDNYFATKYRLFSQVKKNGCIVLNADDKWGKDALGKLLQEKKDNIISLSFGKQKNNDFNRYNVRMASLMCSHLGLKECDISNALKNFPGVPGRLQKHYLQNGAVAFVDFAHKSGSFESVLRLLRLQTDHLIVVFGCGGGRDKTKRPVMGKLAAIYGDEIFITDDNPRDEDRESIIKEICAGIPTGKRSNVTCISDRGKAIKKAIACSHSGSIIAILGKGHESYYLCKGKTFYFNDFEEISKY